MIRPAEKQPAASQPIVGHRHSSQERYSELQVQIEGGKEDSECPSSTHVDNQRRGQREINPQSKVDRPKHPWRIRGGIWFSPIVTTPKPHENPARGEYGEPPKSPLPSSRRPPEASRQKSQNDDCRNPEINRSKTAYRRALVKKPNKCPERPVRKKRVRHDRIAAVPLKPQYCMNGPVLSTASTASARRAGLPSSAGFRPPNSRSAPAPRSPA
jgi:hypothetical protein